MLDGLSLFFPCHNEEANVEAVIKDALRVAAKVASRYEVIIVDDGSTDHTAEISQRYAATGLPVKTVRHEHCMGYGAAVRSGIKAAQSPWVFFSDGDRQFNLDELPRLVDLTSQAELITGYRLKRADPWYRKVNSRLYEAALHWFLDLPIRDVNCAFKLFRSDVFDHLSLKCTGALINAEIFSKARRSGYRIAAVGVSHKPRTAGKATGAQLRVIFKAMKEFWSLWKEFRYGTK